MQQEEFNPRMENIAQTGFSASDPDDETFYLEKIGTYPGELPYEIEHTVDVKADIYQDNSESHQESNKSQVLPSPEETRNIPIELEQQSFPPKEKVETIVESESKPFHKSGLIEKDLEPTPYEKSGLIPKEASQPFEKEGTIKEEIGTEYEKSGLTKVEEGSRESTGVKSIWDIFEKEPPEFAETKAEVEEEKKPSEAEPVLTEVEVEESSIVVDEESVIDFPAEIKISEYDENDFANEIDEDFRNRILEDLERSKQKNTIEREIPTQDLFPTSEIEDLQKELQRVEEKPDDTKYIEVDLTAIDLPQPSKIIAEEIKQEPDSTIEPWIQPKEKKDKEEKKKKKKLKAKPIADVQAEQFFKEGASTIKAQTQVEEQQIEEQRIEGQITEEKKKKPVLVVWLSAASLLTLLLVIFFFLKPLWFNQIFEAKKSNEPTKNKEQTVKDIEKIDKRSFQKPSEESKLSSTLIEKPNVQAQLTKEIAEMLPPKEPHKEPSKPKTEIQPKINSSDIKESTKSRPTTSKATLAWKPRQESAPVIEIVPQREYSVEIFSTHDPEEANYLLNLLNQKQVSAYIKVQVIKNANLYKVRVGSFKNLDDAKEFAKQFGFKNLWIDRIR